MIGGGLTDLDELVLTCRTDQARDYIREALQSYRAGAYRAAIVVTWIAVAFDLIDKLRELDSSGDAQAKALISGFDATLIQIARGDPAALTKALQFERDILATARSQFQLLDDHQHTDMQRLFQDRNRCAHPTFETGDAVYQPSAELARAHLRNAIVHVLQQPPVQGRAAIEAVLARIRSAFFPTEPDLIRQVLDKQIGRARPALINGLIDRLIWDMFDGSAIYAIPSHVNVLRSLLDLHRGLAEPRVGSQAAKVMASAPDNRLSVACTFVAQIPEAWDGLDEAQRDRFFRYLANGSSVFVANIVKMSLERPALREAALQRIKTADLDDLGQMIAVGVRGEAVERAVELFANSRNWHRANQVSAILIMPLIDHIGPDHVRAIIRSPTERGSDLRSAVGMGAFVAAVRQLGTLPKSELDALLREHGHHNLLTD